MEVQTCPSLVINAPEFFADPAFMAWLGDPERTVFTWHRRDHIAASEWSDTVVLVDPGLNGEGADSDMPEHIWNQIVEVCRQHFQPGRLTHHIMVRLTNIGEKPQPHTYECEECDWKGSLDEMDPIKNVHERVLPGEFMAAGQCPDCGSLIGVADVDIPDYTLRSAAELLAKRGWAVKAPAPLTGQGD